MFRHLRVISDVAAELKYKPFFDYLSNRGLLVKILKICKNIDHQSSLHAESKCIISNYQRIIKAIGLSETCVENATIVIRLHVMDQEKAD